MCVCHELPAPHNASLHSSSSFAALTFIQGFFLRSVLGCKQGSGVHSQLLYVALVAKAG